MDRANCPSLSLSLTLFLPLFLTLSACGTDTVRVGVPATDPGTPLVDVPGQPDTRDAGPDPSVADDAPAVPDADDAAEDADATGGEDEGADPGDDPGPDLPADPGPADPGLDLPDDVPVQDLVPVETTPTCVPNHDGRIDADEMPVMLGGGLTFTVNGGTDPVPAPDLQGTACAAGTCWDFSAVGAGDVTVVDEVRPVADLWFATTFPDDAFVLPVPSGGDHVGIYRKAPAGLLLLGLASGTQGGDLLVYDPPVLIVKYPVTKGATWTTERAEAKGTYDGTEYPAYAGTIRIFHTWQFVVNGEGDLTVPLGTVHAFRTLATLDMIVENQANPFFPFVVTSQRYRVYDFLTECLGLAARVRSEEGEDATFFDTATEYRRLGK